MFPSLAMDNMPNSPLIDSITFRQFFQPKAISIQRTNLQNLLFCKFGTAILFAMRHYTWILLRNMPTLFYAILHILLIGASPKMQWIHTWPTITSMTNFFLKWDWAIGKFIGYSMRSYLFVSSPKSAIPVFEKSPFPYPTTFWASRFINLRPKTLFPMLYFIHVIAFSATIIPTFFAYSRGVSFKGFSALLTKTRNSHFTPLKRRSPQVSGWCPDNTYTFGEHDKTAEYVTLPGRFYYTPSWGICQCP